MDHPQSTNVSSPIQQAKQRRQRRRKPSPEPSARQNLHSNGYADDGFVVSDEQDIDDDSSDTDGFEPLRVAGESRSATQLSLGPPITTDESMSKLDGIHRMVVDEFVRVAKIEGEKVRNNHQVQVEESCASNADRSFRSVARRVFAPSRLRIASTGRWRYCSRKVSHPMWHFRFVPPPLLPPLLKVKR